MSIGFGQYLTGGVFLVACFFIIASGPVLNRYWATNIAKTIEIHLNSDRMVLKKELLNDLKKYCRTVKIKQSKFSNHELTLTLDVVSNRNHLDDVDEYLITKPEVIEFCY